MDENYADIINQGKTNFNVLLNKTIYSIEKCNEGIYEYFPYIIKSVSPYGSVHMDVWNIYAEDDYCKTYKSFYELGKTFTFSKEEADKICKELNEKRIK